MEKDGLAVRRTSLSSPPGEGGGREWEWEGGAPLPLLLPALAARLGGAAAGSRGEGAGVGVAPMRPPEMGERVGGRRREGVSWEGMKLTSRPGRGGKGNSREGQHGHFP